MTSQVKSIYFSYYVTLTRLVTAQWQIRIPINTYQFLICIYKSLFMICGLFYYQLSLLSILHPFAWHRHYPFFQRETCFPKWQKSYMIVYEYYVSIPITPLFTWAHLCRYLRKCLSPSVISFGTCRINSEIRTVAWLRPSW